MKLRTFIILIALILIGLVSAVNVAHADYTDEHPYADDTSDQLYVCRTYADGYGWVRLEFHNIPQDWLDNGFWYVADGASLYGDTLVADALVDGKSEPDYHPGQAAVGNSDYSITIVGDENSPACDSSQAPAEDVTMNGTEGGNESLRAVGGQCYLAFIQNGDGGESRVDDGAHPDGIVWKADEAGAVHLITGGGGQSTNAADYRLQEVPC